MDVIIKGHLMHLPYSDVTIAKIPCIAGYFSFDTSIFQMCYTVQV